MVAVGKLRVDHIHIGRFDIVRNDKAVNGEYKAILIIGLIAVAAGGDGNPAFIIGQLEKMLRYQLVRKSCRPGILLRHLAVEKLF